MLTRLALTHIICAMEKRLIFVAPDELISSIDDWRFAHRAGSRSDAIRKLIQAALGVESNSDSVGKSVTKSGGAVS